MHDELLPLRMTSIERFHLLDDSRAWPNWIGSQLSFAGALDEGTAREALRITLQRHVWGHCRADSHRWRWHWTPHPDGTPAFHFSTDPEGRNWLPEQLPDPRSESAARFCGWTNGVDSRISFLVHHALADGLGGLQFVRDWLLVYDNLFHGRAPASGLPPLEPGRLLRRNQLGLLRWSYLRHLWKQPLALFGASKFLFRRFAILAEAPDRNGALPNSSHDGPWPRLLSLPIDAATLQAVKQAARKWNISLNEWLLGCLFEAVASWRSERTDQPDDPWLRMIVPISLREKSDTGLPAANRTTLVQLDRRTSDFHPRIRLMQGLRFELGVIRQWQLDRIFLVAIRVVGLHNRWLAFTARWQKQRATIMLTNLGKPLLRTGLQRDGDCLLVGPLRLERMELVAPVKNGMPAAFAVHQYRNQLQIDLQYDPVALTRDDASRLLELFAARIRDCQQDA